MNKTATTINGLSSAQLRRAADIKDRIETLQTRLGRELLTISVAVSGPPPAAAQVDRRTTAATRQRLAAAMRRRWRAVHRKGGNTL